MRSIAAPPIERVPARPRLPQRPAVSRPPVRAPAPAEPEPSIGEALAEVAAAGQDLVADRLELMKLELVDGLKAQAVRAVQLAAAAVLLLLGWLFLMAAAVSGLAGLIGVPLALLAVGGPHVLVGFGLAARGAGGNT